MKVVRKGRNLIKPGKNNINLGKGLGELKKGWGTIKKGSNNLIESLKKSKPLTNIKDWYYKKIIGPAKEKKKQDFSYIGGGYKSGDIIKVHRGKLGIDHYGIIDKVDKNGRVVGITDYGNPNGMDARFTRVSHGRSLSDFAGNDKVSVERSNTGLSQEEIQNRIKNAQVKGHYNLFGNNCEHFARGVLGDRVSTQVNNALPTAASMILKRKGFSNVKAVGYGGATQLIDQQMKHTISNNGFNIRKNLSKDLGGLSHFNKYQTTYLTAGSSLLGGLMGRSAAKRKARRDARRYGLKEGSYEYDEFIRRRKNEGMLKGAGVGALGGFGASKGVDFVRGKVISDKARVGQNMDLGKNYFQLGKSMRGIRSEEDIENIKKNWAEVGDYAKNQIQSIMPTKG